MPEIILSQIVYSKIYVMLLYWDRKNTRKGNAHYIRSSFWEE